MITFFTIPKPFTGKTGVMQLNALKSWRTVAPSSEIVICGDEAGARAAAAEVGARWLPEVATNSFGTPLLGSTFQRVAAESQMELLAYLNADIILLPDFMAALRRVTFRPFLLVARRWNLDLEEAWDFEAADWSARLRRLVAEKGELFRRDAIDCFVFPRKSPLVDLPQFAVGRPCWDNWFIYNARRRKIPVIDATAAITLVHQNHGYGHVLQSTGDRWEGPEATENRALLGGVERLFDIGDANYVLTDHELKPRRGPAVALRRLETAHLISPLFLPLGYLGYAMRGMKPFCRRKAAQYLKRKRGRRS